MKAVAYMRAGDVAWLAIFGYEVVALIKKWELLSEAMDRYRIAQPVLTYAGIGYCALHLARRIPERVDPLTLLGNRLQQVKSPASVNLTSALK